MLKNTVTGSFLAKLFPTTAKFFLENASQDDVNKAEQEAAVIHQQLNGLGESGAATASADRPEGAVTPDASSEISKLKADLAAQQLIGAKVTVLEQEKATAEGKVTDLTGQLTTVQQERDQYKAWYDKQAGKGTALPGADATNRGATEQQESSLSAASAAGLAIFRQRQNAPAK